MSIQLKTKFINETAEPVFGKYIDGSTAIQLYSDYGELLATATVCLENISPEPGNVFIKNYSENEGVYGSLKENGVIGQAVKTHYTGFVEVLECPLMIRPNNE